MDRRLFPRRLDGLWFGSAASTIAILGLGFAALYEPARASQGAAFSFLFQLMILLIALSIGVFFAFISSTLYKRHRFFGFFAALFLSYVLGLSISGFLNKLFSTDISYENPHLLLQVFASGGAVCTYTVYFIQRLYTKDFRSKEEEWWGPGGRGMQSAIMMVAFAIPYAVGAASDFGMF